MIQNIIMLVIGLAIGIAGMWFILRSKSAAELAELNERLRSRDQEAARLQGEASAAEELAGQLREQLAEQNAELASTAVRMEEQGKASAEKLKLLEDAKENLKKEFSLIANQIFESKGSLLADEHRKRLGDILSPFSAQLADFKSKVEHIYVAEGQQRTSLLDEIKHLKELNNRISQEAVDLTNALKGEVKTRGNWGELILERVLEQSGLQEGREYDTQVHLSEKYGGTQNRYPDIVVHLPEGRDVVVDAKMVLENYKAYSSAADEASRDAALKAHIAAVRRHMKDLSSKNYEDLQGIKPLDIVIMCIPNEPAYVAAVANDPELHQEAFKQHILIAGPTTLLLTLKIIATMWRAENQSRNAIAIADRGQKLYEKFVGFVEELQSVGKSIDSAKSSYDEALDKLTSGQANLVKQTQDLIKLGIKAKKQIPKAILEKADADEVIEEPGETAGR